MCVIGKLSKNAIIIIRIIAMQILEYLPEPASLHRTRSTLSFRIFKYHRWALCSSVVMWLDHRWTRYSSPSSPQCSLLFLFVLLYCCTDFQTSSIRPDLITLLNYRDGSSTSCNHLCCLSFYLHYSSCSCLLFDSKLEAAGRLLLLYRNSRQCPWMWN